MYADVHWNKEGIEEQFTEEEIEEAVFDLAGDTSPDPDGNQIFFYQKFWGVLKEDIYNIQRELYLGILDVKRLNYASIVLIPKTQGAIKASDLGPILNIGRVGRDIGRSPFLPAADTI